MGERNLLIGIILVLVTASVSRAADLTGEFVQNNRQTPNAVLCPITLKVQRISDTAYEIYGPISMNVFVTPFGDEGDFIFTQVNQGVRSRTDNSWLVQTVTTMNGALIRYDRRLIDAKTGHTVIENRVQWSVFSNGSAILSNDVLIDKLHQNQPSSTPGYCTYSRQVGKKQTRLDAIINAFASRRF